MGVDVQHGQLVMPSLGYGSLEIVAVPAFSDNYLWLVHDSASGDTAVVDPGDGQAVLDTAAARGWTIGQVWNTHWHADHTGGNLAVKDAHASTVSGPAAETIPGRDVALAEGDTIRLGEHVGEVWAVPGHTLGHIALIFRDAGVAFVGDTMFAMGCGRLFEGTPDQMFASLQRLASLPLETKLYCAHEYTLSNARFAAAQFPDDAPISARLAEVEAMRERGQATVPTTVAAERATNPFLRPVDAAGFTALRAAKDRG